jgi:hypothetical protein
MNINRDCQSVHAVDRTAAPREAARLADRDERLRRVSPIYLVSMRILRF